MRKDRFLGVLLGLALTAGALACAWYKVPFTESLENKLYDLRLAFTTKDAALSDKIMLVAIDEASIAQLGRWPWPRGLQGELIRRIASGGPRVLGVNILWIDEVSDPGMEAIGQLKEKYLALLAAKKSVIAGARDRRLKTLQADLDGFGRTFDEVSLGLDQDARLAEVLSVTSRVVLPIKFQQEEPLGGEGDDLLARMPFKISKVGPPAPGGSALEGFTPDLPLALFASDVSGMGFSNVVPDVDGSVRAQPVAFRYRHSYFPSLPVEMARLALGLNPDAVLLVPGRALKLGEKTIPLDSESRLLLRYNGFYSSDKMHSVSAVDILTDKVDPVKRFKDKIVLVARRATGEDTLFVTPASTVTAGGDVQLNAVQDLLGDRFIVRPEWAPLAELGALAFVGFIVVFVLPFLRARGGFVIALLLLAGLGGGGFYLFLTKGWWIKVFYPMALLASAYGVVILRQLFFTEKRKELVEAEGIETNKALGLSFQGQGILDMAFEKFRRCPVDTAMKELLYNLALDFERKRQFGKAAAVYGHIASTDPSYKDVKAKIAGSKQASETMIAGPGLGRTSGGGTVVVQGSSVKPTLGRYEIQKELGRGAMGIVYLGRDPKINRQVAIKTLKFDDDMDAAATKEIKERFFREAESAGTLNHPNIIRVYDAGDDNEISFIAMEFLEGEDLKKFTEKINLLPPVVAMDYAAKVADALDYAHAHGVVHRDVKPANVMRLKDGSLRVTDFGIARITASSKTTTGTVMGTPSYMAPEQIAGKKVDGRADLFSLGVMMYELLAGVKPFEGDSIATLLFKISNEPHPDPIPRGGGRVSPAAKVVIDRALQKDPEKRYQKGADMARDIREAMRNPAGPAQASPTATLTERTMPLMPPAPPRPPSLSGEATLNMAGPSTKPAPPPAPPLAKAAPPAVAPTPPRPQTPAAPPRPPTPESGGEQTVKIPAGPPTAPPAAPKPPAPRLAALPTMSDMGFDVVPAAAPPPPPQPPAPQASSGAAVPAPGAPASGPEPVFEIVKDISAPPPRSSNESKPQGAPGPTASGDAVPPSVPPEGPHS